ncbi:MAG: HNH endonuclease [Okeania sp. SIO3B5]|uniref:HNH endonuclease n=1 Tax=Okeania sp. SIO3B5 TaxID=2607811 RepID=UPI0014016809|nr:HNH endonuclease signature motif containing protein [Okeania sp. SIO3B5]NEO52241.1 HNH endonuclease [Okeania sp. SIO3B5]
MSKTRIPSVLRRLVRERANECCEYCLIPEILTFSTHEIDHIIAEKHGGLTEENNLALSCTLCNQYKGTDLTSIDAETGEIIPLYHPRKDVWLDHFLFKDGRIIPSSTKGRVTVRLLQFNRPERIEERQLLIETGLLFFPRR